MLTTIKIILIIIFAVALVTALWRLIHDWLQKAIPYLFWGIVGLVAWYYAFKFWWSVSEPPDAKTKATYDYIIDKYNGNNRSNRAGDSGQSQDYPQR